MPTINWKEIAAGIALGAINPILTEKITAWLEAVSKNNSPEEFAQWLKTGHEFFKTGALVVAKTTTKLDDMEVNLFLQIIEAAAAAHEVEL